MNTNATTEAKAGIDKNASPEDFSRMLHSQFKYLYEKPSRLQRSDTNTTSQMQKCIANKMQEPNGAIF